MDRSNTRSGHLPGGHHLEWLKLVNERDHTVKEAGEMRSMLEGAGITPEKTVHMH